MKQQYQSKRGHRDRPYDRRRPHGKPGGHMVDAGGRFRRLDITDETPFATAFAELGVPNKLAHGLGALGILEPFPIQAATIGDAMAGIDVLGRGRTGSGKTLAFGLPLMARLMEGKTQSKRPRGMILTPTRELAMQVNDALAPLAQLVGLHLVLVIGGAKYERQIDSLHRGADILVATPGRLEDLIKRGDCSLDQVAIAVLDEADQMADMGFLPIVDELMSMVPRGGQRLLFSATLDRGVDAIVKKHLESPVEHATEPEGSTVTTMEHHVFVVQPRDKYPLIRTIATRSGRCIAFVRTQRAADELCEELTALGVTADALHGGKSQGARNKALSNLKEGRVNVLVATDVAARGIHVDGIDLVLNVDMPRDFKDYLHRAGRTARAGASGRVVSVTSVKQTRFAHDLMAKAGVEAIFHRVTADADVVAELTGATSVETRRPRREDREEREERPRDRYEDRRRDDRQRDRYEDRPRRDDRRRDDRPRDRYEDRRRDDRPRDRFEDRPRRDDRNRDDREQSRDRFEDRPRRDDRDRFDDRPRRDDRNRDDREQSRERFDDRPRRDERPRRPREDRPRREHRHEPSSQANRKSRRAHLQPKAAQPVAGRRTERRDDREFQPAERKPRRKAYAADRPNARSTEPRGRRDDAPRGRRDDARSNEPRGRRDDAPRGRAKSAAPKPRGKKLAAPVAKGRRGAPRPKNRHSGR